MACHTAEAQLVKMVKAQIGTPAILADVDGHLEAHQAAERLGTIIPESTKPTLCTFFETYVLPTCFYDDKPRTIESYRNALKLWRLITGDPPIEEITAQNVGILPGCTFQAPRQTGPLESGNQHRGRPVEVGANHSGQGRPPGPPQPGCKRADCLPAVDSTAAA